MATETLQLIISVAGGGGASDEIKRIDTSARSASASLVTMNRSLNLTTDTLRFMRGALVAISFAKIFEEIGKGISTMQSIHNLLTQVTSSAEGNSLMFEKLGNSANAVRAPLEDFAKMFVNIERSTAAYGRTTDDVIKANQTMFASFALSGLDNSSIHNVSRDMREVFNLGIVQGRQFRAIVTQDQYEALLLSKYMVATGANAAAVNKQLDEMRSKGQTPNIYELSMQHKGAFTGADVLTANIASNDQAMQDLAKTSMTLGQAFTFLSNQWLLFLNGLNQSTGIFTVLADGIKTIAEYLPEVIAFAAVIASLLAINFVTSAFLNFASLVKGAFLFVLSPILAVAEALLLIPLRLGGIISVVSGLGRALVLPFVLASTAVAGFIEYMGMAIAVAIALGTSVTSVIVTDLGAALAGTFAALIASLTEFAIGFAAILAVAVPAAAAIAGAWMAVKEIFANLGPAFDEAIAGAKNLGLTSADIPMLIEQAFGDMFNHFKDYETILGLFGEEFGDAFVRYFVAALKAGTRDVASAIEDWFTRSPVGKVMNATLAGATGLSVPSGPGYRSVGSYLAAPSKSEKDIATQLNDKLSVTIARVVRETADHKIAVAAATANGGAGAPADQEPNAAAEDNRRKATEEFRDYIAGLTPGGSVLKALAEAQKQFNDAAHKGVPIQQVLADAAKAAGLQHFTEADALKQAALNAAGLKTPMDDLNKMQANYAVLVEKGYKSQDEMNMRLNDAWEKAVGLKGGLAELTDKLNLLNAARQKFIDTNGKVGIDQAQYAELTRQADVASQIAGFQQQGTVSGGIQAGFLKAQDTGKTAPPVFAENYAEEITKTASAAQDYTIKLQVLNAALAAQHITQQQFNKDLVDAQLALLKAGTDAASGFAAGMLEAQRAAQDAGAQIANTMKQVGTDITDALSNALEGKRTNFIKMGQDIGNSLIHAFVSQNVTAPLMGLMGPNGPAGSAGAQALGAPFNLVSSVLGLGGAGAGSTLGASVNNPMFVLDVSGAGIGGGKIGSDVSSAFGSAGNPSSSPFGSNPQGGYTGGGGDPIFPGSGGGLGGMIGQAQGALGMFKSGGPIDKIGNWLNKELFGGDTLSGGKGLPGADNPDLFDNIGDEIDSMYTGASDAVSSASDWFTGLFNFAQGGEFLVGGQGGVDSQLVAFRATPDETVSVRRPGQMPEPIHRSSPINVNVYGAGDPDTFRKNSSQITGALLTGSARQARRDGRRS